MYHFTRNRVYVYRYEHIVEIRLYWYSSTVVQGLSEVCIEYVISTLPGGYVGVHEVQEFEVFTYHRYYSTLYYSSVLVLPVLPDFYIVLLSTLLHVVLYSTTTVTIVV